MQRTTKVNEQNREALLLNLNAFMKECVYCVAQKLEEGLWFDLLFLKYADILYLWSKKCVYKKFQLFKALKLCYLFIYFITLISCIDLDSHHSYFYMKSLETLLLGIDFHILKLYPCERCFMLCFQLSYCISLLRRVILCHKIIPFTVSV